MQLVENTSVICIQKQNLLKTQKEHLKLQQKNIISFKKCYKILEYSNDEVLITDNNIDNGSKKRQEQNDEKYT